MLNAANEIAVAAFLEKQIRFDQIHTVNRTMLDKIKVSDVSTLEGLLALDNEARARATEFVRHLEL